MKVESNGSPVWSKPIGLKSVFKLKQNSDGSINNTKLDWLQKNIYSAMKLISIKYLLQ